MTCGLKVTNESTPRWEEISSHITRVAVLASVGVNDPYLKCQTKSRSRPSVMARSLQLMPLQKESVKNIRLAEIGTLTSVILV